MMWDGLSVHLIQQLAYEMGVTYSITEVSRCPLFTTDRITRMVALMWCRCMQDGRPQRD